MASRCRPGSVTIRHTTPRSDYHTQADRPVSSDSDTDIHPSGIRHFKKDMDMAMQVKVPCAVIFEWNVQ